MRVALLVEAALAPAMEALRYMIPLSWVAGSPALVA